MRTESFFQWKLPSINEAGDPVLVTPRSDPFEHEFPIDFQFDSQEQARSFLVDWDIDPEEANEWVLVKVTHTVVSN